LPPSQWLWRTTNAIEWLHEALKAQAQTADRAARCPSMDGSSAHMVTPLSQAGASANINNSLKVI